MAAITSLDESKKKIDRFLRMVLHCLNDAAAGNTSPFRCSLTFPAMEPPEITYILRALHLITRGNTLVDFVVSVRLEAGVPGHVISIEKRSGAYFVTDAIRQLNLLLDNPPKKDSFDEATTTLLIRED